MRRRDVSAEELAKIIRLRHENASWLKIQREIGVPRRIAQRAYEQYERSQAGDELSAARQTVAAEELRNHLAVLKKLAGFLVRYFLEIPRPSTESEPQSAKQFLESVLGNDIAGDYGAYGLPGDPRRNRYPAEVCLPQNQLLFKSLQAHTNQRLNLSGWESAYDTCREHQAQFLEELHQVFSDILNQGSKLKLAEAEARASRERKITGQMLYGLVSLLWEGILAGKVELEELVSQIKLFPPGDGWAELAFGNLAPRVIVPGDVGTQAEEACVWAIKNLLAQRKEIIDPLLEDVKTMRRVSDDLVKVLNPLTLVPDILHSKCNLCPC